MSRDNGKQNWKEYFKFGEVVHYFFRKKDPEHKPRFNLRVMHGINRLSIIMFLIALIIIIIRNVFFR